MNKRLIKYYCKYCVADCDFEVSGRCEPVYEDDTEEEPELDEIDSINDRGYYGDDKRRTGKS